jgi:hypothetical protein
VFLLLIVGCELRKFSAGIIQRASPGEKAWRTEFKTRLIAALSS